MSNTNVAVSQPAKVKPMLKEDKEYWKTKVEKLIRKQRSDLRMQHESTIQKMKDDKWKPFLASLKLDKLIKEYEKLNKDYHTFKQDMHKTEMQLREKARKSWDQLSERVDNYVKIRKWESRGFAKSFEDDVTSQTDCLINYLSKRCYDECEIQFNESKGGAALKALDNTEDLLTDALHLTADPAVLGLIKQELNKAGINNTGILGVDVSKYKMLGQ